MSVHTHLELYHHSCETSALLGEASFHQDHGVFLLNSLCYQQQVNEFP